MKGIHKYARLESEAHPQCLYLQSNTAFCSFLIVAFVEKIVPTYLLF